jgi:hypothetical protein
VRRESVRGKVKDSQTVNQSGSQAVKKTKGEEAKRGKWGKRLQAGGKKEK